MHDNKLIYAFKKNKGSFPRLFSTFLDNSIVFLTKKSPQKGPLFVVWDITANCNLRCLFCGFGKTNDNILQSDTELPLEQKIKIIKNLAERGVWFLSFCGGEPLLCKDLEQIVKEAKSQKLVVNVSTNGFLLEEKARTLINSGVDFVTISIDGYNPELLEQVRGHKGLFEKIEAGIKAIRVLSKKSPVFIEARYLINKKNYFFMHDFVKVFGLKVNSIIFKPIYQNPNVFYNVPEEMKFSAQDEASFKEQFTTLLKNYKSLDTTYHRNIPLFLFHPEQLKGKFLCFAGTFFGGIDFKGNLFTCHELTIVPNESSGNLNNSDLIDLWRSEKINALRTLFKTGARCNCWMDRFSLNIPLQKILVPFP